jgi:N-acyl-D-amino-acid deacylase
MRNEADQLLEAIEESMTIARSSSSCLLVSHLKAQNKTNWTKQEKVLRMLDDAIASGMRVYADRYPYVAFNTGLMSLFPIWSREGGTDKFLARLRDVGLRSRLEEEVTRKVMGLSSWDAVMIGSVHLPEDRQFQGKSVQQIAAELHVHPYEFTVDLLLREGGGAGMVGFGMDEAGTEMVLAWKNACVASDGGAYSPSRPDTQPHPRSYGTFPRAIGHYQRERRITSLPDMIRKMTALPAEVLGIKDRGVIVPGKAADLVIFDYERIADRATFVDPHRFPDGIPFVFVNGIPVVDCGRQTGALPGKVLRSS